MKKQTKKRSWTMWVLIFDGELECILYPERTRAIDIANANKDMFVHKDGTKIKTEIKKVRVTEV